MTSPLSQSPFGPARSDVLADIVRSLRAPPCAPKVIPLLKRHLTNPNVPIPQIVELIRLDPGVSARVLQAANSALFKRGERCHSVELAVNRIGFDHIFEIVANAVAEQVIVRPLEAYVLEADEFWRRSVACGIAAERLAEQRDEDVHVAYVLGLLHGVGMVAIDQWTQRHAPRTGFRDRGFPRGYTESEQALLGVTHAEVGAAVLRSWEFPLEMAEPLRWQYSPVDGGSYRRLNCLLYAARWVSARACAAPGETVAAPDPRLLAPIRLNAPALAQLWPTVRDQIEGLQRRLAEEAPEVMAWA